MACRSSIHQITGYTGTPNRLFLGREVNLPVDLMCDLPASEKALPCYTPYVQCTIDSNAEAYALANENTETALLWQKKNYD